MKRKIKKRIIELLLNISIKGDHHGLLIVFSDLNTIIKKGIIPLGTDEPDLKNFEARCNIFSEQARKQIKIIGDDGAVLIDKSGTIYSPSVYLNVNALIVDKDQISPEFAARHIAALATSTSTKAHVYTLSEETGIIREFYKGKIRKEFPNKEHQKILSIIKKDLKKARIQETELSY